MQMVQAMSVIRDLRVAVGFLTRIPVGDVGDGGSREVSVARAVPWFPLVGAAIGALHGGVWRGLSEVMMPLPAAALATACALLVTGAFHHDGLADIADAFGGGWTVEQRFEILKDSRLGTYGTAALATALIVEVAAVSSLSPADGLRALVAAHVLGRSAAVLTMTVAPVAGDGLGASYIADLSKPVALGGVVVGLVVAAASLGLWLVWAVLASTATTFAAVGMAVRKVGGVTGDVLGAIVVCATLASLLAIVVLV